MVYRVIGIRGGILMTLWIPSITVATFIIRNSEHVCLVIGDGQVEDVCAVAFHVAKTVMESPRDPILAFVVGLSRNRPVIFDTGHLRLLAVEFLMEFQIQPILDGATAVRVIKDDFVVSVLMIGDPRLVPIPTGSRPVCETLILVEHGGHLVLVDRKHQFLHFQATMVVDGVEIGNLAILVIEHPMEVVGVANTDGWVNDGSIVMWIHRQIKSDDTVAAMDAMVGIGHLTGLVISGTIESIALAFANEFRDGSLVVSRPVVQMQIDGLVATKLGLLVVFIHTRLAHLITIEVVNISAANGFTDVFHFVGMHHDADTYVLGGAPTVVGDMAGIGCGTHGWCSHRMLDVGIV